MTQSGVIVEGQTKPVLVDMITFMLSLSGLYLVTEIHFVVIPVLRNTIIAQLPTPLLLLLLQTGGVLTDIYRKLPILLSAVHFSRAHYMKPTWLILQFPSTCQV